MKETERAQASNTPLGHGHHHGHHHGYGDITGRRLLWTSILNIVFTAVEVVGGIISNSLSLLSDALHNLADSSAIFIAYLAHLISKRSPDQHKTFGYKRFEIIAAFFNSVVLVAICLYLFVEAYRRFLHPEPIHGLIMMVVASAGLLANLASVLILRSRKGMNLNVRAAYLHLLGDTMSSVAVIVGGVFVWKWEVYWLDPLITVLVGIFIIYHTWRVLRETTDILMQGVPPGLDLEAVRQRLSQHPEVLNVHHIHAWRLNDTQRHIEVHVTLRDDMPLSQAEQVRLKLACELAQDFGISHTTLQLEYRECGHRECLGD